MDPLSEVLSLLETRNSYFAGLRAGGDWAFDIPAPVGIKFSAVVEGTCWLTVEDAGPPVQLHAGDCVLLARPRRYSLASDLSVTPIALADVYRVPPEGGISRYGEADDFFLIGGRFSFEDDAKLLLDDLPPLIVVRGHSEQAAILRWALQQLAQEFSTSLPGASLMVQHLAHMMLVQILRLHADSYAQGAVGWLAALADPRIAAALNAIHAEPARRWTVDDLAARCNVSRSTFALHFKRKMGFGPLDYLLRWRMQLATRKLRRSDASVSAVAQELGYDSDSAFSHAFKRIIGCSPREYRAR
ncbi:AraC family transcriptional regulator [Paraburkholderia megapolitana]|uniref:AraC family transcriptional regulator n=1 Tax=Paraburkholderia megapolitana TaxID=420953 RepID=UPI0038BBF033